MALELLENDLCLDVHVYRRKFNFEQEELIPPVKLHDASYKSFVAQVQVVLF